MRDIHARARAVSERERSLAFLRNARALTSRAASSCPCTGTSSTVIFTSDMLLLCTIVCRYYILRVYIYRYETRTIASSHFFYSCVYIYMYTLVGICLLATHFSFSKYERRRRRGYQLCMRRTSESARACERTAMLLTDWPRCRSRSAFISSGLPLARAALVPVQAQRSPLYTYPLASRL